MLTHYHRWLYENLRPYTDFQETEFQIKSLKAVQGLSIGIVDRKGELKNEGKKSYIIFGGS